MASVHAWQLLLDAALLTAAALRVVNACLPDFFDLVLTLVSRHLLARLKKRADFLRVSGARCKWVTPGVLLQAAPAIKPIVKKHAHPEHALEKNNIHVSLRLGFTVSKKVGNAVVRNRARRRLREVASLVMPQYAPAGYDYVLIGRRETAERDFSALVDDLKTALRRLNLPDVCRQTIPCVQEGNNEG